MPVFAGYTTTRELHRTGLGSVSAATKGEDASRPAFAVKVCRPDALVLPESEVEREVGEFLARAELARKIGDSPECDGRWAKVHALGRVGGAGADEDGARAYCVTDFATLATAEKLVAGRVRLDGPTLAWLIGEVVEGLRALEAGFKRGHGNLKPSNVLICGDVEKELRAARVVLCDIAIGAEKDPERARLEDLRGIGSLIHALVLHTRFRGGWPVEPSANWNALGRDGAKWRELVNTLLDPNPRAERPTLDELAARLKPLAVRKRSRTPLVLGVAAAVLLAGVATGVVWHYRHREVITIVKWNEKPELHAQEWRDLCAAYRGWYSLFQDGLGKPPTMGLKERGYRTRREAYAATDPQLKELLALPGIAEGYDPWSIAHVAHDTELSPLANAPTDYARSDTGVDKTEAALGSVDAIKKGLTEGWHAPQRLKDKAATYKQLGWNRPAGVLESAAANVNPDKAPDPAVAVDSVLSLVPIVEKIDASWARIQATIPALAATGDPTLAKFASAAAGMVGQGLGDDGPPKREDLLTLEKQATSTAELAGQLEEFAKKDWPAIDEESFTSSAKYPALIAAAPSVTLYGDWLAEARKHPSLDPKLDPRADWPSTELVAELDAQATTLTGKLKGAMDPAVGARLARARADVPAVAREKLPWKRTNKDRVEGETARLKQELIDLKIALDRLIADRRVELAAEINKVKDRMRGRNEIAPGSPAINEAWRGWRDAMLASFSDDEYEAEDARAKALEGALARLGTDFPPALPKAGEGVPDTDWAAALADASATEREARLGVLLGSLGSAPPDPAGEKYRGAVEASSKDFAGWTAKLGTMRTELGRAEEAMNSGQDTAGSESIDAIVTRWTSDPIAQQKDVKAAIGSIRERVEATKALQAEKSVDVLVGKVMHPEPAKPELTLAAWRRLGDADIGWPRTVEQLGQGVQIKGQLAGVISKLPESRRDALGKKIDADMASRWAKYAATLRDPRALETAFLAAKDYSVDEAALPPALRYDLLVWRLRADAKPDASDDEIVQKLGAFDHTVRSLGSEVLQSVPASKLLADAAPLVRGEELVRPKVDPRTLGPGRMGGKWQAALDTTTADLTFTHGSTSLLFVRVALPAAGPDEAVYICARELSIGDAAAIVDASGDWAQFKTDLPALNVWVTPRGWTLDARGLLITQNWMQADSNMTPDLPGYPPGILQPGQIARVDDSAGGEPRPDSPLQEIPAYTLAYVARLAGSRFPTSAEWLAAHQQFDGGAVPSDANLRDATFEKQRHHIEAARGKVPRKDAFPWPDAGAFAPTSRPASTLAENAKSRAQNDGILWFAPTSVGGGAKVHHLVGNVAELVVEDGRRFEETKSTNVRDIQDMLGRVTLEVIGGSALSDPDLPIDKPLPIDAGDSDGYADVGARLAFNAAGTAPPHESFAVRLRKLLTDDAYLLSSR